MRAVYYGREVDASLLHPVLPVVRLMAVTGVGSAAQTAAAETAGRLSYGAGCRRAVTVVIVETTPSSVTSCWTRSDPPPPPPPCTDETLQHSTRRGEGAVKCYLEI